MDDQKNKGGSDGGGKQQSPANGGCDPSHYQDPQGCHQSEAGQYPTGVDGVDLSWLVPLYAIILIVLGLVTLIVIFIFILIYLIRYRRRKHQEKNDVEKQKTANSNPNPKKSKHTTAKSNGDRKTKVKKPTKQKASTPTVNRDRPPTLPERSPLPGARRGTTSHVTSEKSTSRPVTPKPAAKKNDGYIDMRGEENPQHHHRPMPSSKGTAMTPHNKRPMDVYEELGEAPEAPNYEPLQSEYMVPVSGQGEAPYQKLGSPDYVNKPDDYLEIVPSGYEPPTHSSRIHLEH